jgi:hypothetical protein
MKLNFLTLLLPIFIFYNSSIGINSFNEIIRSIIIINGNLIYYGKIFIKDQAFDDQLEEIVQKQAEKESIVNLKLVRDSGPQHFYASHSLPYANGIPMRLFIRYLHRFCMDLAGVYSFDKESVLKKKS